MNVSHYSGLVFELADSNRMDEDAQAIRETLIRRHHKLATLPEDFQIQNQKSPIDTEAAAAAKLEFLVRWVGFSALFVAGLGILARARTYGRDRHAKGAWSHRVRYFFQFLFEAAIVSLVGCLAGLAAGWESSRIIAQRVGLPFCFDWGAAQLVIALPAGLNLAFALFPSGEAALLNPVRALKYE